MCINNKSNRIYDAYERLRAFHHCCQHIYTDTHRTVCVLVLLCCSFPRFFLVNFNALFLPCEYVCTFNIYTWKNCSYTLDNSSSSSCSEHPFYLMSFIVFMHKHRGICSQTPICDCNVTEGVCRWKNEWQQERKRKQGSVCVCSTGGYNERSHYSPFFFLAYSLIKTNFCATRISNSTLDCILSKTARLMAVTVSSVRSSWVCNACRMKENG